MFIWNNQRDGGKVSFSKTSISSNFTRNKYLQPLPKQVMHYELSPLALMSNQSGSTRHNNNNQCAGQVLLTCIDK